MLFRWILPVLDILAQQLLQLFLRGQNALTERGQGAISRTRSPLEYRRSGVFDHRTEEVRFFSLHSQPLCEILRPLKLGHYGLVVILQELIYDQRYEYSDYLQGSCIKRTDLQIGTM